jgi:hypothetical protein
MGNCHFSGLAAYVSQFIRAFSAQQFDDPPGQLKAHSLDPFYLKVVPTGYNTWYESKQAWRNVNPIRKLFFEMLLS